jgi:hypothetical protein
VLAFLEKANKAASTAAQARAIMERKAAAAARAAVSDGRAAYSGGRSQVGCVIGGRTVAQLGGGRAVAAEAAKVLNAAAMSS